MRRGKLLAVAAIAAIAAVPGAQARSTDAPPWKVVASGLDNPRGIAIARNGDLWIAEAGKGGAGPCAPGGEGAPQCFGASGAFTLVHGGTQRRVVTGLPSIADQGDPVTGAGAGAGAVGASDIVVNGGHVTGLIGGGGSPATRSGYGDAGALAGWIVKIDPATGTLWPFADLLAYEAAHNPDGGLTPDGKPLIDSDAYGLAQVRSGFVVADAAGNDLLGVRYHHRRISTIATFAPVSIPAGPFGPPGTTIPYEAVPTTVAVRPHDPNLYVGQLTGFPFPAGMADVWAVEPDGDTHVYASGFTTIVDIAWGPKGSLYVLQLTSNGLTAPDPGAGSLVRVWPNGTRTTVASTGLSFPTAVAIARNGDVYVTNNGTSPGTGEVLNLGKV